MEGNQEMTLELYCSRPPQHKLLIEQSEMSVCLHTHYTKIV